MAGLVVLADHGQPALRRAGVRLPQPLPYLQHLLLALGEDGLRAQLAAEGVSAVSSTQASLRTFCRGATPGVSSCATSSRLLSSACSTGVRPPRSLAAGEAPAASSS